MKKSLMLLSSVTLLLAAIALCVFILPANAYAAKITAGGTCGKDLTWTLDTVGTLTISGYGGMDNFGFDIEMGWSIPWYNNVNDIRKVTITKGVTTIGDLAFGYCVNLTEIIIPNSVT